MSWRTANSFTPKYGPAVSLHRHDSGLSVIHARESSSPIVSFQSWLRVGSSYESPGKTGMAHFFEHLMFAGTQNHPLGEFDRLTEERGGDTNAATWLDWTSTLSI